ncbi:MAG: response regulator transcription factor [Dysgonamonadaceae bacterium]|jgi:two-component system alkaline phosphatase synthesis response regulator PhoP|nr:response regulator transcription factor [Dysgonamonadaceae bacterium]
MNRTKLLIVDDEEDIREILQFNLENEGFQIDAVSSGEEALEKLSPEHKLILLDVMMDGISGFRMAEKLRKENVQTPIIFLTAKSSENDLLTGFSVGADDYISKPFSIKEVIARVKAITRRDYETIPKIKKEREIIVIGDLRLNLTAKNLELNNKKIFLTKKEFEILSLLIQHPQRLFSREEILQEVWQDESYVLERTVDVHVARLRKKLNHYNVYIANRSGYGYSFNDSVRILPQ